MWLWQAELHHLGFRRRSEHYWQCERRHGLPPSAHLSIWPWSEQGIPGPGKGKLRYLVEVTEFHVTFLSAVDHLHFYFHERDANEWKPGGHTSSAELRRLGENPRALRALADVIAQRLIESWGGRLLARRGRRCRQEEQRGETGL